jgi:hypothetical protein
MQAPTWSTCHQSSIPNLLHPFANQQALSGPSIGHFVATGTLPSGRFLASQTSQPETGDWPNLATASHGLSQLQKIFGHPNPVPFFRNQTNNIAKSD